MCKNSVIHGFHVDQLLYYMNDDGQTIFKNGKAVDSIANRMVLFDGGELHTGTTTTNRKVRCVINNYIPDNLTQKETADRATAFVFNISLIMSVCGRATMVKA